MFKKKYMVIFVSLLMFIPVFVRAEDTSCSYTSQAALNSIAGKISASFDYKYDKNNNVSFDISLYNLTSDVRVEVQKNKVSILDISGDMAKDGKYTINDKDTSTVATYTFTIVGARYGCNKVLRTLTLIKPRRNELYDLQICKYAEVKDYYYCKEWVTQEFTITENEAIDKIMEERERKRVPTTSLCLSCEQELEGQKKQERYETIKRYIIVGLIIGIVLDLAFIIITTINIRRNSVYD